jgi:hypothetical protein
MPKPVKKAIKKAPKKPAKKSAGTLPEPPKRKRPADPMKAARAIMGEHMSRVEPPAPLDFETAYRKRMAELGAKGGKIGGKRRMETMLSFERSDVARKAALARWSRAKTSKKT